VAGVVVGALDVFGLETGDTAALVGVFNLGDRTAALGLPAPVAVEVTAGVAWSVTGGGWTVVGTLACSPPPAASAAIDGSNRGMRSPASEVLGAGPIAAPMATPRASIPAAKAVATRSDGRRGMPEPEGGEGVSGGVVMDWIGWGNRHAGLAFCIN
jgi:hypothetical protein